MNAERSEHLSKSEQLYFSMFPTDSTEKFRKFLLFMVFNAIKADDGVTLNKLQWQLNTDLSFSGPDVEIAVNALANQSIFHAISKYHLPKKKGQEKQRQQVIHLRLRKDRQNLVGSWVETLLVEYPEYSGFLK